jgi:hypothetical protein
MFLHVLAAFRFESTLLTKLTQGGEDSYQLAASSSQANYMIKPPMTSKFYSQIIAGRLAEGGRCCIATYLSPFFACVTCDPPALVQRSKCTWTDRVQRSISASSLWQSTWELLSPPP